MVDVVPPVTARRPELVLGVSSLAVLTVFLDTTALFVAFPDLAQSFPEVSSAQLSWVLNAYTIVFAALLVPAGKVADRVGHKRSFLVGVGLFMAGSLLSGLAPNPTVLIGTRMVQAVGAAVLLPSSLALILRAFPRERIPVAVAIWGATGAVAAALGPTLGAALVEWTSWRWVFYLNLPVGLFAVIVGSRVLLDSRQPETRLPAPGGVSLIAGAAALLSFGVVQSEQWGWVDGRTVAVLVAGAGLLVWFVASQRRSEAPVLDLELFRIGNFAWGNAATLAFGLAFIAMFFGSILFLTEVWGWSILAAGFGIAPGPLLVAVLAPFMGRLAARHGQRSLLIGGGLFFAAGGLWRLVALDGTVDYLVDYLPSMVLTGFGVAMCLPQLSSVTAQALPPDRLGVGGAVNQAIRQFGGTFGVALTVAFLGQPAGVAEALAGFDQIWMVLIVGGIGTALLSLPLRTEPGAAP
ncbi:MAG: DHA2 family efflux MFS transporter permease subunit [Actinomycetota bacterium]